MALGKAVVEVTADTTSFTRGLSRSVNRGLPPLAGKVESSLGGAFKRVAVIAGAALAGGAVLGFFNNAITQAADLGESINAIEVTLGDGAEQFLAFGESAATALGVTQSELNQAIIPTAALLKNAGLEGQELSTHLQDLATRATDVGSVFNTDTNAVLQAFGGALRGETEPIRAFGVNLNQAGIDAKAMALGLADADGELSTAAKTQATYALILEQTEQNAGDFQNTITSLPNLLKVVKASLNETAVTLGNALIPAIQGILQSLLPVIERLGPVFERIGGIIGDAIEIIAPALEPVIDAVLALLDALAPLIPVVAQLAATVLPIFARIITEVANALAPVIAAIADELQVALVQLEPVLLEVLDALIPVIPALAEILLALVPLIPAFIQVQTAMLPMMLLLIQLTAKVIPPLAAVIVALTNVLVPLAVGFSKAMSVIGRATSSALGPAEAVIRGFLRFARNAFNNVVGFVRDLPGRLARAGRGMFDFLVDSIRSAINRVIGIIRGFGIPGFTVPIPLAPDFHFGGAFPFSGIPFLAQGGFIERAGAAVVGERGAELLQLPRGASVSPLDGSGAGFGDVTVEIHATGPTLQDIVRVQLRQENRALRARAMAGSTAGTVGAFA